VLFERASDHGPCFTQIHFTILGEEGDEGRFFGEGAALVIVGSEGFNLVNWSERADPGWRNRLDQTHIPFINVIRIPWLVFLVRTGHCGDLERKRNGSPEIAGRFSAPHNQMR
jgi:hypothetical protein